MRILVALATVALCPQDAEAQDDQAIREQLARTPFPRTGEMSLGRFVRQAAESADLHTVFLPSINWDQVVVVETRQGLTVDQALETTLPALDPPLTWEVRRRVLLILPLPPAVPPDRPDSQAPTFLESYYVRDITYVPWDNPGPDRVFGRTEEPAPSVRWDYPGPDRMFGRTEEPAPSRPSGGLTVEDLRELIQDTIEPESWEVPLLYIVEDGTLLWVNASERVHERIRGLLDRFRATSGNEVHIEGRLVEMPTEDAWSWLSPTHEGPAAVMSPAQVAWLEEALGRGLARTRCILRVAAADMQRNNVSQETWRYPAQGDAAVVSDSNVLDVRPILSHDRRRVLVELRATFSQPATDMPRGPSGNPVLDVYRTASNLTLPRDRAVVASAVAREDGVALVLVLRAVVRESRPEEVDPAPVADEGIRQAVWESLQVRLHGEGAARWLRERPGPDLSLDDLHGWLPQGRIENWSLLANTFDAQANVMAAVVPAPWRAEGALDPQDDDAPEDGQILGGVVSGGRVVRGPGEWIFDVQHSAMPTPVRETSQRGLSAMCRVTRATLFVEPGAYRIIAEHGSGEELVVTLVRVR